MIARTLLWQVTLALLSVTLYASRCAAEDLSLSQTVEQALTNNPSIAADRLSADALRHAARGARALINPEISVAPGVIGKAGADSAIFFLQALEINGTRRVRGEIAVFEANAAAFGAATTRRDVVLRVKQTYWDIGQAQEMVRLNEDNLRYLDALRVAVQKQYDVGAVPGSQVIKTDVEIARARQELAQAQLELAQRKASMNALLNRPVDRVFAVTDPLVFDDVNINREQFQATAQTHRPEFAAAQAQAEAARKEVREARLRRLPDLAIQARRETFESDSNSGVAVAVTLPLLDWGSVRADVERAESAAQSRQKQLEAVKTGVALDIEQAFQVISTSSQIVREYQGGILVKSEELAKMARTGYEKGATSYLEALESQRTLRSTRAEYYSALADYAKALAKLEWATGYSLPNRANPEVKK